MMKNKSIWILIIILSILFFLTSYVYNNRGNFYSLIGDYYFKKNNIELAQKNYEKAFSLGFNKLKQRDIYINSIINSPLTTEAQEKVLKFLEYPKKDVASLKAEYFIYDLKREIHRKYPYNFITNAVYNQKIVRWANLPIKYKFEQNDKVPQFFIKEIENALTKWEVATKHQIYFLEDTNNPNIIIKFEENVLTEETGEYKYVVAYTTPIIDSSNLKNIEIVFYLNDVENKYFTNVQVYNTALHEIAHALGFMGHSDDKKDVMYLTKDSVDNFNNVREELTEADISTIELLYKVKPEITNSKNVKAEYIPFLVLGTEKEVINEKIREAKNYINKAPNLAAGYIDLAEAYVAEKDYSKAIKSLELASKLKNDDEIQAMVYYNLAVTYFYVDYFEKAKENLELSMKIVDNDEKHYLMAEILVREGDFDKAAQEYSSLIYKNPNNIDYVIALTNIYVMNRQFMKARQVLRAFYRNNPTQKNNPRLAPYGVLRFLL